MNPIYGQAVRTKTSQVLTPAHRIPQKDDNLYNYTGTKKNYVCELLFWHKYIQRNGTNYAETATQSY